MNHLHLCKLHDYVNYSNISIRRLWGLLEFGARIGVGAGAVCGESPSRK